MNKLPYDIIYIISSYYGNKIPTDLSKQINDQRLLYAIKEREYYNKNFRTWHISKISNVLLNQDFIPENLKKIYNDSLWKNKDNIINKMWWKCSEKQRNIIIQQNFSYAFTENTTFITFKEFFYTHFGYHII
jgi:hypothetical protein